MKIFAAGLMLGVLFLVAQAREQERKIKREQLPAAVEKTVAAESQGATIKGFASEREHGQQFYEVSLIVNGHHKDILIDRNGHVVEVEEEVSFDSLPQIVQETLRKRARGGKMTVVESLTKQGQLVAYEAHIKHGIRRSEIQVGPNGEKLKRPE
jgi:uncharacterized membrane protein YkoI